MSLRENGNCSTSHETPAPQALALNMRMHFWTIRMGVLSYAVCVMLEMMARHMLNMPVRFTLVQIFASLCLFVVSREDNRLVSWMWYWSYFILETKSVILSKLLHMVTRMNSSPAVSSSDFEEAFPEVEVTSELTHVQVHSTDLQKFCSLFTSGYKFDKDTMVQMWVAEGLFEPETSVPMEVPADDVFDYLVQEKVIQSVKYTICRPSIYRMQDTHKVQSLLSARSATTDKFVFEEIREPRKVSELADRISSSSPPANEFRVDESELRKVSQFAEAILLVSSYFNPLTFHELSRFHNLCTIILVSENSYSVKHVPIEVFFILKNLRLLDLHRTGISELPRSIWYSKGLRYIDMSETPIKSLPEGTTSLCELQTLKLRNCFDIKELPRDINKLTNLRHLDVDILGQLRLMPVGIGNLTKLQTLSAFLIDKTEGRQIGELKNLNNLKGSLYLEGLENVSSSEEAAQANIIKKKYLTKLQLSWRPKPIDKPEFQEKVLDCLQPHSSIKELEILHYTGFTFPSWLSDPNYVNIVTLSLYDCGNSHHVPTLGVLQSLRNLHLSELNNVKSIDHLFRCSKKNFIINAFPKLEELTIDGMINLRRWTGIKKGDFPVLQDFHVSHCPKLSDIPFLANVNTLKSLDIYACPALQSLPSGRLSTSLETLSITDCSKLKNRCVQGGKDWFKVAHVPEIDVDGVPLRSPDC